MSATRHRSLVLAYGLGTRVQLRMMTAALEAAAQSIAADFRATKDTKVCEPGGLNPAQARRRS